MVRHFLIDNYQFIVMFGNFDRIYMLYYGHYIQLIQLRLSFQKRKLRTMSAQGMTDFVYFGPDHGKLPLQQVNLPS